MKNMPELPINLGGEAIQADGVVDKKPFYQSHRGKFSDTREYAVQPPIQQAEGFGRYED